MHPAWPACALRGSALERPVVPLGSSRRGRRKAESFALDPDPRVVGVLWPDRRDAERDLRRRSMEASAIAP